MRAANLVSHLVIKIELLEKNHFNQASIENNKSSILEKRNFINGFTKFAFFFANEKGFFSLKQSFLNV